MTYFLFSLAKQKAANLWFHEIVGSLPGEVKFEKDKNYINYIEIVAICTKIKQKRLLFGALKKKK